MNVYVRSIDFVLQQRLIRKLPRNNRGKKASKSIRQKWCLSGNLFWRTLWKSEVKLHTVFNELKSSALVEKKELLKIDFLFLTCIFKHLLIRIYTPH